MRILISNDDGVQAPGIQALSRAMQALGEVCVVAPDRDRSGASSSLTLTLPVRVRQLGQARWAVEGTPTDCVHLAVTGMLKDAADIVVSGINAGANMGDDVLYSGTVAAAIEGRYLGLPAVAVSLCYEKLTREPRHFDTAAWAARRIVERLVERPLPADTILNINVPDLPVEAIRGFQATRLGRRHKAEPAIPVQDPRGRRLYWIGPAGAEQDAGPGTDFHAVAQGYVSITPVEVDMTRYDAIDPLGDWLDGLEPVAPVVQAGE